MQLTLINNTSKFKKKKKKNRRNIFHQIKVIMIVSMVNFSAVFFFNVDNQIIHKTVILYFIAKPSIDYFHG